MSPKRGDRVTVPPPDNEWDVRFGTGDAVKGWEEPCRHALANTRRCLETLRADPRSRTDHERRHRLRGDLATHRQLGGQPAAGAPQRVIIWFRVTHPGGRLGLEIPLFRASAAC
jgi:hypothetical protein